MKNLCHESSLLCLMLYVYLSASALAQQRSISALNGLDDDKPVMTFKALTREVVVPVSVHDKKGKIITSLALPDFTLTEDGRPQILKSLNKDNSLPLRIGMLCDTSRSMRSALESERKAANSFIDQILPEDPKMTRNGVFLVHFDSKVELLKDFTKKRNDLHDAINSLIYSASSAESVGRFRFR